MNRPPKVIHLSQNLNHKTLSEISKPIHSDMPDDGGGPIEGAIYTFVPDSEVSGADTVDCVCEIMNDLNISELWS